MPYSFLATAAFGLEGIVSNELKRLGYSAKAEQGCARFTGELADGFRANLCLRTADRVLLLDTSVKAAGPPAEVFASPAFRDAFPGHK